MKYLLSICVGMTVLFSACKKDSDIGGNDGVNQADRDFAQQAAYFYLSNMSMGNLALSHSTDSTILALTHKMVASNNVAYTDLQVVGEAKSIGVPGATDVTHMALLDQMAAYSGTAFDSFYIHTVFHEQHELFEQYDLEISGGSNATMKQHAQRFSDTMGVYHEQVEGMVDLY